ncbi:DUF4097 family beta strand repeat-containing protein [Alkalihalobacillus sp. FSL R5-0424]
MKKLIGFAMIVLGLILLVLTTFPLFFSNFANSQVDNVTKSLDGINTLSLESKAIHWTIVPVEDEELRIELANGEQGKPFKVEQGRSQLNVITEHKRFGWFPSFSNSFKKGEATVYLPKSFTQGLDISTVSGDITFDGDITLDELNVEMVSGEVMNSGNVQADEIDVDSVSGHVHLVQVTSSDIHANTVSGDVLVQYDTEQGDLSVDTVSGKVGVTVPTWNAAYELDTLSGTIMDQGTRIKAREFSSSIGNGNAEVEISTLSGDITLN